MLQFYFLSVLLNLMAGLIFIYAVNSSAVSEAPVSDELDMDVEAVDSDNEKAGPASLAAPFLSDKTFQLVIGILAPLTGIMKLLSPLQGEILIIGDLIPACAGIASGAVLLLDWLNENTDISLTLPDVLQNIYTGGRKYLGIFCIAAAVLHFIFPLALFL
ncbi:hypothetical protein [Treponema sp.]|uniref:hypothetical protein n=1 Tax=Treponema sp. TaxID=166 RepID=UPI00388EAE3A